MPLMTASSKSGMPLIHITKAVFGSSACVAASSGFLGFMYLESLREAFGDPRILFGSLRASLGSLWGFLGFFWKSMDDLWGVFGAPRSFLWGGFGGPWGF